MLKKIFATLSIFSILLTISACNEDEKKDKLDKIQDLKKIIVYTNATFPPFEYMSADKIVGVDIDLAGEIAKDIGVELELKNAEFDGLLASLASGKGDCVISAMTVSEKRKEQIDFSESYFSTKQCLIVPQNSNVETIEDLAEKRIVVCLGYSGQNFIEKENDEGILKDRNINKSIVNDTEQGVLEITSNKADVFVIDEDIAKKIVQKNEKVKMVEVKYKDSEKIDLEEYAVAVPKDNPKLLETINNTIKRLKTEDKFAEWVEKHNK